MKHLWLVLFLIASALLRADAVRKELETNEDVKQDHAGIEQSQPEPRGKPTRSGTTLGLGPSTLGNLNAAGVAYYFVAGHGWDVGPALIRVRGELALDDNRALFTDFNLGLQYYFMPGDFAPFAGADLGLGIAHVVKGGLIDGDTRAGFIIGGSFGAQLFRTHSVSVELGIRLALLLKNSTSLGKPFLGAAFIAIAF